MEKHLPSLFLLLLQNKKSEQPKMTVLVMIVWKQSHWLVGLTDQTKSWLSTWRVTLKKNRMINGKLLTLTVES